jgi:anti-sigma factor RsiW
MNDEQQLKLQAFVDGELPEKDAREMASWVARDEEAAGLARELRHTRQALADAEPVVRLPEAREFYWSKIRGAIERLEAAPLEPESVPVWPWLRRFLVPAGAIAAMLLMVAVAGLQSGLFRPSGGPETELALSDSGTFTYRDYANGTTLVWLEYPAER